jgi:hypothetical protein
MGRSLFDNRTPWERFTDAFRLGWLFVLGLATMTFMVLAMAFLSAWGEMLIMGILHHDWWHHMPTMGFGAAFKVNVVLMVFVLAIHIVGQVALSWFKAIVK